MLFLRVRTFIILAAVLAVVFISYLPALKSDFVLWDDDVHILDNITIRGLDREHLQEMFTSTVSKIYIPLTSLSFAVEHHYFGYNPFIYHLDNVLLHLFVTAFVFVFARQMGLSRLGAAAAALLFGIHPMHVESVAWATERKDVLYAFFYMAAVLSYGRYLSKGGYFFLAVTTVLGVLSMLAKPMALSLPLILFLLDWFHGRTMSRRAVVEKIPLFILICAIAWVTYSANARMPVESVVKSILIWPWTFVFYLRQFVFPFFSVPIYRLPKPIALSNLEYLLSVAAFVLIVYAVIRWSRHWRDGRRNQWFLFAFLFWFLSIFFLLRFDEVKDTNIVADRFMYLPSLGFCLLMGLGLERLWGLSRDSRVGVWKALGLTACLALVLVFSFRTSAQCRVWKDSVSLWEHQLKFFPQEYLALNNLATALYREEEYKKAQEEYRKIREIKSEGLDIRYSVEAVAAIRKVSYLIELYKKVIEIAPEYVDAHYNLANLYSNIGMVTEAVKAYIKTLSLDPGYKDAHFNLGSLYQEIGDYKQAIYAYEQTIASHPDEEDVYINVILDYNNALKNEPGNAAYQEAQKETIDRLIRLVSARQPQRATSFFNLGFVYGEMGDFSNAILAYRRVLELNPRHAHALYNLGNAYRELRRFDEALMMYERAVQAGGPRKTDALLNIGIIQGQRGDYSKAKDYYQKAIQADPANAKAYFNLGYISEKTGHLREAVEFYQKAVHLNSKNAQIHYNLGNAYTKLKMEDKAIFSYLQAVQKDPKHMDAWVNLSIISFKKKDFVNAVKYCDEAVLSGYEAPEGYLRALAPYRKSGKR